MDKLIENYRELFRTLNRLNNTNKGLLLKSDLERLETARKILSNQESYEPRVVRSDENSGLNIAYVSGSLPFNSNEELEQYIVFKSEAWKKWGDDVSYELVKDFFIEGYKYKQRQ